MHVSRQFDEAREPGAGYLRCRGLRWSRGDRLGRGNGLSAEHLIALPDGQKDLYNAWMSTEFRIKGLLVADYVDVCLGQNTSPDEAAASLLAQLTGHPEESKLGYAMANALLANDALDVWSLMGFENIPHWLNREAEHAVQHCPNVINAWTQDFVSLDLAAHAMTTAFAWISTDDEKIS